MTLTKILSAMVECPKGSNQKFDFDPKEQRFRLSKILPAGLHFPFDFGMLPGTRGEDGMPGHSIARELTIESLTEICGLFYISIGDLVYE